MFRKNLVSPPQNLRFQELERLMSVIGRLQAVIEFELNEDRAAFSCGFTDRTCGVAVVRRFLSGRDAQDIDGFGSRVAWIGSIARVFVRASACAGLEQCVC